MENNHREKSLGDKLRDYRDPVDQKALWEGIKHQIPIKNKKTYWPIPLVFLLGAALGFGINELSHINTFTTLNNDNKQLTEEKIQLQQDLKICSQQKHKESIVENKKPNFQQSAGLSFQTFRNSPRRKTAEESIKRIETTPTPVVEVNKSTSNSKVESPSFKETSLAITSLPTAVLKMNQVTSWNVEFKPVYLKNKEVKPLVWFFEGSGGTNMTTDHGLNNQEAQNTRHQSIFNAQVEAGIQKQLLGKWYGNLGISYQFTVSKQAYETTTLENIFITDTTGIFIGTDGVRQTNVGDVLAQKWVTKSGLAFHTRHLLSLKPGLEYEVYNAKGKHLSLVLSLAIPIWFQNTGSLVNDQSGKQLLSKNQFLKPDWPWSLGVYYQWPMQSSSLGLLLRVHHDKQKIVFNDKIYVRNFWLPQAGMRILF